MNAPLRPGLTPTTRGLLDPPRDGLVVDWHPLTPADLPGQSIDPAQLSQIRAVHSGLGRVDVDLGDVRYRLQWIAPTSGSPVSMRARLHTHAGPVDIGLESPHVFSFWPDAGLAIDPELLTIHLLEEFEPFLQWFAATFGVAVTGLSIVHGAVRVTPLLTLLIRRRDPAVSSRLHVLGLPRGIDLSRIRGHAFPIAPVEPWRASLPLRLCFRIGCTRLAMAELRRLRHGDVLMVDDTVVDRDRLRLQALIEGAATPTLVLWADGRLATVSASNSRGEAMTADDTTLADTDADALALNDLEVTVTFSLGHRTIKLGELEAVKPGYVFELDTPLNRATVQLSVNRAVVGVGQLVALGDRLGVRLTRLSGVPTGEG
jgi:type III secretion system YscQ/HrcQ family protein